MIGMGIRKWTWSSDHRRLDPGDKLTEIFYQIVPGGGGGVLRSKTGKIIFAENAEVSRSGDRFNFLFRIFKHFLQSAVKITKIDASLRVKPAPKWNCNAVPRSHLPLKKSMFFFVGEKFLESAFPSLTS